MKHLKSDNLKIRCILLLIMIFLVVSLYIFRNPFVSKYVLEAGDKIKIDNLLKEKNVKDAYFVDKIDETITNKVGEYKVKVHANYSNYNLIINVVDTTNPKAILKKNPKLFIEDGFDANKLIDEIYDYSNVKVSFKNKISTELGKKDAVLLLEDEHGNKSEYKTSFILSKDTSPPKINLKSQISLNIGENISYKKFIFLSDNRDEVNQIAYTIDNSKVKYSTPGTYPVTIKATDRNGNSNKKIFNVLVKSKDSDAAKREAKELAKKILSKIISKNMNKKQKLEAIYTHVQKTYKYVGNKHQGTVDDYYVDALNGLKTYAGDCYIVNAMARFLMEEAGIQTIGVSLYESPTMTHISFMANAGDGWYHYCAFRKVTKINIFRYTDKQYISYGKAHYKVKNYDFSSYPSTPMK